MFFAAVKEFWKSIKYWQSYSHDEGGTLTFDSRCIYGVHIGATWRIRL